MVRVRPQRVVAEVLRVALRAHRVAVMTFKLLGDGRVVGGVRIVACGAIGARRTRAKQEVARLARVDVAPSRGRRTVSIAALPRVRVVREEHLVTASARVVDAGSAKLVGVARLGVDFEPGGARHERRLVRLGIRDVSFAPEVTRLAPDADLDQIARVEVASRHVDRLRQQSLTIGPTAEVAYFSL